MIQKDTRQRFCLIFALSKLPNSRTLASTIRRKRCANQAAQPRPTASPPPLPEFRCEKSGSKTARVWQLDSSDKVPQGHAKYDFPPTISARSQKPYGWRLDPQESEEIYVHPDLCHSTMIFLDPEPRSTNEEECGPTQEAQQGQHSETPSGKAVNYDIKLEAVPGTSCRQLKEFWKLQLATQPSNSETEGRNDDGNL